MIQFISQPIDGAIQVPAQLYADAVEQYQGKQVIVTIEEFKPKTLKRKRSYYFAGIVKPLAKKLSITVQQMHDVLKLMFNPVEIVDIKTGEVRHTGGSTKHFTREEWEVYIAQCIEQGESIDVKINTPEEYYESIKPKPTEATKIMGERI